LNKLLTTASRRLACTALTGFLALTTASSARAQAAINFGLGATIPIGSSADRYDAGFNALLSFSLKPSWMRRNMLRFEGAVNGWTEKGTDVKYQVQSATANLVILGGGAASPTGYVIIGAGSYQTSGGGSRRSHPGFNAGTGIRYSLGFVGTFVEARFHYVADEYRTKYFPMSFGLTF